MAYIKRLLKMHNCTVLIIPKPVCRFLNLQPGDYVALGFEPTDSTGRFHKIPLQETPDNDTPKLTNQQPSRRRP